MKTEQVSLDMQGAPFRFFNRGPHTDQLGFWNYSLLVLYFLQNRIVGELTQMEVWNKKESVILDMKIDGIGFWPPNHLTAGLTQ